MLSVTFHLSCIYPLQHGCQKTGLCTSYMKSHFNSFPDSVCTSYKCRNARKISSRIFYKKAQNFYSDSFVTKAFKTDDDDDVSLLAEVGFNTDFNYIDEEDEGNPWAGAVVYRRNSSIMHVEYCTTLERLGLGKISSELSRSRASAMGLRITKAVKDYVNGTPALISVDVTRRKQKLRLDGIIKTVISLACNRCGQPAAESIFSNFSLLLTEEPIEDPEVFILGTIYAEDKSRGNLGNSEDEDDEEDASIDLDDRLYFPPEEKEIDISKHVRDMIHLEITIDAVCDPKCKGLCLNCGTNLNISVCSCREEEDDDVGFGPLGKLKKQLQHK